MAQKIEFSPEQESLLRQEWVRPEIGTLDLAELFGVSESGLRGYAKRIGLPARPVAPSKWSDERVELLTKLWKDNLSASQIAKKMGGLTRNGVIGKLHRLGLVRGPASSSPRGSVLRPSSNVACRSRTSGTIGGKPRSAPTPKGLVVKRDPYAAAGVSLPLNPKSVKGKAPMPKPMEIPTTAKVLADLGRCECRWHVGPDPGAANMASQLFCAAVTPAGETYCAEHKARAYYKTRTPEQRSFDADYTAQMRTAHSHRPSNHAHLFVKKAVA